MTHKPLYAIMGGFQAIGAGLIAYGFMTAPAHAQHPGSPNYAPMANYAATVPNVPPSYPVQVPRYRQAICRHLQEAYPVPAHFVVTVDNNPGESFTCSVADQTIGFVGISFPTVGKLMEWTEEDHTRRLDEPAREILPDPGDGEY